MELSVVLDSAIECVYIALILKQALQLRLKLLKRLLWIFKKLALYLEEFL